MSRGVGQADGSSSECPGSGATLCAVVNPANTPTPAGCHSWTRAALKTSRLRVFTEKATPRNQYHPRPSAALRCVADRLRRHLADTTNAWKTRPKRFPTSEKTPISTRPDDSLAVPLSWRKRCPATVLVFLTSELRPVSSIETLVQRSTRQNVLLRVGKWFWVADVGVFIHLSYFVRSSPDAASGHMLFLYILFPVSSVLTGNQLILSANLTWITSAIMAAPAQLCCRTPTFLFHLFTENKRNRFFFQ